MVQVGTGPSREKKKTGRRLGEKTAFLSRKTKSVYVFSQGKKNIKFTSGN